MKKYRKKPMLMVEMVCAVAVLGIITACFYMTLNHMQRAEAFYIEENRAILVLDNTMERVNSFERPGLQQIKEIFSDEFSKSSLSGKNKFAIECKTGEKSINLSLKNSAGRILAAVEIPKKNSGDKK